MKPEQIKHLEFIQNVITRMNTNSFQIKAWSIVIVSALMAIYASTQNNYFFLTAIFPTVIFWFLDAYYLNQERKFRGLYNDVAGYVMLGESTSQMSKSRFSELIEMIYAFGSENDVIWSEKTE